VEFERNTLPQAKPLRIRVAVLRQVASPLIYVLVSAALLSLMIKESSDGVFISAALIINAVIGSIQKYSAQRNEGGRKNTDWLTFNLALKANNGTTKYRPS
jgi:magnesium-transporting ATPase (P-type)